MTNKIEIPDLSKYPNFEGFIQKKDKFILDDDNNTIPADLMTWGLFLEEQKARRIVKQDTVNNLKISTVFIGLDHKFSTQEERQHPDYKPHIFETMIFTENGKGQDCYCCRYATWKEAEKGHQRAIAWVNDGCIEEVEEDD